MKNEIKEFKLKNMSKKENIKALAILALTFLIIRILYFILNNSSSQTYCLVTDMDKAIPFIKGFIIPYVIWYPFIFGTLLYFCFKDKTTYYITIISINISVMICFIIYFLFQTTVPRPQIYSNDFLSQIVKFIYLTDKPVNCFPSIHVLTSFLMVKGILKSRIKNSINIFVISFIALAIIMSTLFVKQHVVLDVMAAILLGDITLNCVSKVVNSMFSKSKHMEMQIDY